MANEDETLQLPELDETAHPVREFNVGRRLFIQEVVRAGLAVVFALFFLLTIIWAFVNVSGENWANTKELLQVLLPAETAILGAAVGFYFGSQRSP